MSSLTRVKAQKSLFTKKLPEARGYGDLNVIPSETSSLLKKETKELFDDFLLTRDSSLREKIIESHLSMARFFAKRFGARSDQYDDLLQVATIGLINAVDRFDADRGAEFATFATITILGEIKRYFRDKTWSVKVPRRFKDLNLLVNQTIEKMALENDHVPTYEEISKQIGCSVEEILESREAVLSYRVVSLDREIVDESGEGSSTLIEMIGETDSKIEMLGERLALQGCLKKLKEDERFVVYNRYYENMSQAQIAKLMNVSQMQISRLQSSALQKMQRLMKNKT